MKQSNLVQVSTDISITEKRLIQIFWETKSIQYIANMLGRGFKETERQVLLMSRHQPVKLYRPKTFEVKKRPKEANRAVRPQGNKEIKIPDNSKKIAVRINAKTLLLVDPGTDVEALKREYSAMIRRNEIRSATP